MSDLDGQEREALNDQNRGIFQMKRAILKTLCALDLTANANNVLRSEILPKRSGNAEYIGEEQMISVALEFSIEFDWDLTL